MMQVVFKGLLANCTKQVIWAGFWLLNDRRMLFLLRLFTVQVLQIFIVLIFKVIVVLLRILSLIG
jgi:hypothetical protein